MAMRKAPWEEEELTMNGELREAFDEIRRENKLEHTATRALIRELETRLNAHLTESAITRARVDEHFEEHKANRRWRMALWAGVILALIGAGAACLSRFIK